MRPSHISLAAFCLAVGFAAPGFAQTVDFGTDTSRWANDGECDDPRFQGAGMTATSLLEADIRADATDCRTAFEAGTITLIDPAATAPAAPAAPAPAPAAEAPAAAPAAEAPAAEAAPAAPVVPAAINYGDDSGGFANDRECDDRRFTGAGMAANLSWSYVGADATDCRAGVESGALKLWVAAAAAAATQCSAINFGDDSGAYPNDNECDDIRFEGLGVASFLGVENLGKDAADCSRLCAFGVLALRDY